MKDWLTEISKFSAAEIVAALGCPRKTAYAWLSGQRHPPEWLQPILLAWMGKPKKRK
jgi:hypothetical protein